MQEVGQNLEVVIVMGGKNGVWEIVDVFCNPNNASEFIRKYRADSVQHALKTDKCAEIARKLLLSAGISPVDQVGTNIFNPEYWKRREELISILWQEFYNEKYEKNKYPIDEFKTVTKTVK